VVFRITMIIFATSFSWLGKLVMLVLQDYENCLINIKL